VSRGVRAVALADGRARPELDLPRAEAAIRELLFAVGELLGDELEREGLVVLDDGTPQGVLEDAAHHRGERGFGE